MLQQSISFQVDHHLMNDAFICRSQTGVVFRSSTIVSGAPRNRCQAAASHPIRQVPNCATPIVTNHTTQLISVSAFSCHAWILSTILKDVFAHSTYDSGYLHSCGDAVAQGCREERLQCARSGADLKPDKRFQGCSMKPSAFAAFCLIQTYGYGYLMLQILLTLYGR